MDPINRGGAFGREGAAHLDVLTTNGVEVYKTCWELLVPLPLSFLLQFPMHIILLIQWIERSQVGVVVSIELVVERRGDLETRTGRSVKGLRAA